MAVSGLRHTGIVVPDLDEALSFYRDLLGFKVERRMEEGGEYLSRILGEENITATTVKMSVPGGGMVELLHFPDHLGGPGLVDLVSPGPTHIALTVTNLDALYARMTDQNVPFQSHPVLSPDGNVKIAFCQSPDGTFVELVEEL